MLNKIIKASFVVVGGITGFTLTSTIFSISGVNPDKWLRFVYFILASLFMSALFYLMANKTIEAVLGAFDRLEYAIQKMTLYELALSSVGLIIGLIIANLIIIPLKNLEIIGLPLAVFTNILFGSIFFGVGIVVGKKNEGFTEFFKAGKAVSHKNEEVPLRRKLLDTSTIIDGRIADICRTGFIEGELIVPGFILEELRHIADSPDPIRRNRGRRGLDVLGILQKEFGNSVKIEDIGAFDGTDGMEVDDKLLKAAKNLEGMVVTTDYNLSKVAGCQGVPALNVNELANALKPIAIPGEEMLVQVVKDGKENGQGVGYLSDGTMIVVEGGRKYMGESVNVMVTSVLQTSAGRMIFAKPNFQIEKVI